MYIKKEDIKLALHLIKDLMDIFPMVIFADSSSALSAQASLNELQLILEGDYESR